MSLKKLSKTGVLLSRPRGLRPHKHDISYILSQASSCRTPTERVSWLESLLAWIRSPASFSPFSSIDQPMAGENATQAQQPVSSASVRLRFILHLCERQPEWQNHFVETLAQLATELPATELFCDVGIFRGHGLLGQINGILIERFLPLKGGGDLDNLVTVLFPDESDVNWVEALPTSQIKQFLNLIEGAHGPVIWSAMHRSFADAMLIMASQIAGAGTEREMRERVPLGDLPTSAFFRLLTSVQHLHPRLEGSAWIKNEDLRELKALQEVLHECLKLIEQAFVYLENHGVSVDLVFRFERIERQLRRLLLMNAFLVTAAQGVPESGVSRLLSELIRASLDGHRLDRLFSGKIRLLSRRIVDHTGDSGDHYITRDRAGYFQMLLSAGGGGFFTVGTTIIKATISRFSLPPMLEAFAHSCNYASSFLAMHFCHFTLATKQPSMTASTLARKLSEFARGTDSEELIATIRDAFRSQFAAALGNVGIAIPTSVFVTWVYQSLTGQQIFTATYAHKILVSLNPLTTLTIVYAVLTGFLLWGASLCSGALENWVALHQISQRLEYSKYLHYWLGKPRTERLVHFFTKNLAGASGSIILGVLLALTPFLGAITGIPLDVRHVTLSSSALSMAVMTLGDQADATSISFAAIGVALTGLMNFGVSFFLALVVASRAQNVRRGLLRLISRRVLRTFVRTPLAFFWPKS